MNATITPVQHNNMTKDITSMQDENVSTKELLESSKIISREMGEQLSSIVQSLSGRTDRNTRRILREVERARQSTDMVANNSVDLSVMLMKQPHPRDFRFVNRAALLRRIATVRFTTSTFMFPDPVSATNAFLTLLPAGADPKEMELRIAHFMAHINIRQEGTLVSSVLRRLIQAAACKRVLDEHPETVMTQDQIDIMTSALAACASFVSKVHQKSKPVGAVA